MDLREVGYDGREWINLAQDRDQWRAYVRAAMNLRFLKSHFAWKLWIHGKGQQGGGVKLTRKASETRLAAPGEEVASPYSPCLWFRSGSTRGGSDFTNDCVHVKNAMRAVVLCNFLHSPVTSSLLAPNIFLRTLFSNALNLCFSLKVRVQVSQPYRTTGNITVL
ncbi:hypothetical protein ANN_16340 [Periplaneta americana]|uniref:Uncharacterized protein n=1 Tax=Periplaneta americana TaxID=6978 RepID=A0ABQ8SIR9_PERAM|nr:hypothetical protein ANN_16340 [Periplaneta americana]